MPLLNELKRRNVLRVGAAYLVAAWFIVQITGTIFPLFGLPQGAIRLVVILLAIGLLPVVGLSWVFEFTPEGLRRDQNADKDGAGSHNTGRKLDKVIVTLLILALSYFVFDKFVLTPQRAVSLQEIQAVALEEVREEARLQEVMESNLDRSIAVLPFVNMSSDAEQDYFSDGISEELLNLLARIPELRVISRTSAFSYKNQAVKISDVARELNVTHVLEGSVRKSDNKVRITAQLIEARSDSHLWSDTWDRPLDDIFAVQDEIAANVVEYLKLTLLGDQPVVRASGTEAYTLYLLGRHLSQQRTSEALEQALEKLQESLSLNPGFAPAWVELASIYINQAQAGMRPANDSGQLAREAYDQALQIDPNFASAHSGMAFLALHFDNDSAAAVDHIQKALELEPFDASVIGTTASLAAYLGRPQKAIKLLERLVSRDPLNPAIHGNLGFIYSSVEQYEESLASLQTAWALNPGYSAGQNRIGRTLLLMGRKEEALQAMQLEESEIWQLIGLALVYHALDRLEEADRLLDKLTSEFAQYAAYNIAYIHAFRGEADLAFAWLNKAVAGGDSGLSEILLEPFFSSIHSDSRWLPFLEQIGKSPAELGTIELHFPW